MGRPITMFTNPRLDVEEGSVTPHVVRELPGTVTWIETLAPSRGSRLESL